MAEISTVLLFICLSNH